MGPLPRATHLVTGPVVLSLALLSVPPPTGASAPERLAARPAERGPPAAPPSSELPEDTLERPLPLAIRGGLEVAFEKAGWEEAAAGATWGAGGGGGADAGADSLRAQLEAFAASRETLLDMSPSLSSAERARVHQVLSSIPYLLSR